MSSSINIFDLEILKKADDVASPDRDSLIVRRGEDEIVYLRHTSEWRVLVDVEINGNRWYSNYDATDEVIGFWEAVLQRELADEDIAREAEVGLCKEAEQRFMSN